MSKRSHHAPHDEPCRWIFRISSNIDRMKITRIHFQTNNPTRRCPRLERHRMKRCYLVCYDISDPKRLRQVFRICKGYGEHWQYSVFFCALKDLDRVQLQAELEEVIHDKEDQILVMDLGSDEVSARGNTVALGQPMDDPLHGTVLV